MSIAPGDMLQNRSRIVATLLSQGEIGAVYKACDTRLNIHVALKEMRPQPGLASGPVDQLHQQFRREANETAITEAQATAQTTRVVAGAPAGTVDTRPSALRTASAGDTRC